jgi:hypothetical protein
MIFALIFFPILSFAHIIQDDVSVTERTRHSLKYACTKSGYPDSPLIDIVSGTKIDCMGRKIDASEFCDKELAADPYYLRAYIDKEKQEVVCVTGKKVLFKYLCVKISDKALCESTAEAACKYIRNKLAKRLEIVHSSFVKNEKGIKQLNCFYEI